MKEKEEYLRLLQESYLFIEKIIEKEFFELSETEKKTLRDLLISSLKNSGESSLTQLLNYYIQGWMLSKSKLKELLEIINEEFNSLSSSKD